MEFLEDFRVESNSTEISIYTLCDGLSNCMLEHGILAFSFMKKHGILAVELVSGLDRNHPNFHQLKDITIS